MNSLLCGLTLLAAAAWAQSPAPPAGLSNAQIEAHTGQSPAAAAASARGTAWIAYTVPAVRRSGSGRCLATLERGSTHIESAPLLLEGSPDHAIFVRVTDGAVERISSVSAGCAVDAGGSRVLWLGPVPGAASVAWLSTLTAKPVERGALGAIAHHADPSATALLIRRAEAGDQETFFWLGQLRGAEGLATLERIAFAPATAERARRKVIFGISRSPLPAATALLIRLAANEPEALLWLAHRGTPEARDAILAAADRNPEKAMFALSQWKGEGGVDLLIAQARNGKTPEIRRKAVFWISHSRDPRASAFLRELLR